MLVVGTEVEALPVASGVMDVIAAKCQGLVGLAGIIGSNRDPSDMVDMQVFECDEFREVLALFSDTNGGGSLGYFNVLHNEVLAARQVDGILACIGAF